MTAVSRLAQTQNVLCLEFQVQLCIKTYCLISVVIPMGRICSQFTASLPSTSQSHKDLQVSVALLSLTGVSQEGTITPNLYVGQTEIKEKLSFIDTTQEICTRNPQTLVIYFILQLEVPSSYMLHEETVLAQLLNICLHLLLSLYGI